MPVDYEVYDLGAVKLQRGATIRDCKLAYKTFGTLKDDKSNAIVYPTWYSGQHYENEWLVGDGMALDPAKYFIIIPNMLGNGLSSSPSNTPEPYNQSRFPHVTACDNVRAQHRLVTEKFGIRHLRMVLGWSMGALQTFHWGALYPDMMDLLLPFCGSARCSRHNVVFLEGVKAALTADAAFKEGWYDEKPARGLRAAARVYARRARDRQPPRSRAVRAIARPGAPRARRPAHGAPAELARRRFRALSAGGTDVAIALPRDQKLFDGAVLLLDANRALVVRVDRQQWLRLRPRSIADALELGYRAGNLHWRVRYADEAVLVALEAPLQDYLDRLGSFITDGRVVCSVIADEEGAA